MGRPRSVNTDLPPRMKRRKLVGGERYYYVHRDGWQEPLGGVYLKALERYTQIEARGELPETFARAAQRYEESEAFSQLAPNTRYQYQRSLIRLVRVFGELTEDVLQMTYEPGKTSAENVRKEAIQTAAMALRGRFEDARTKAAKAAPPELAARIRQFQLRDLRAKALTDKEDAEGLEAARAQAGHGDARTTMLYVRNRRGTKAKPTR